MAQRRNRIAPRGRHPVRPRARRTRRLAEIELPLALITEAVFQGHLDRKLASTLDFPGRAEYDAASRALRTLREHGRQKSGGWHQGSHQNIPVVFNNAESIHRIAVTGGDEWTGTDEEEDPKNSSLKGPNTDHVVQPSLRYTGAENEDVTGVTFLYLLTRPDGDAVWVEISEPAYAEDGYIYESTPAHHHRST